MWKKPEPTRIEVAGQALLIRPLTAGELAHSIHVHNTMKDRPYKADFLMLSLCCLDTQGNKLFPTADDAEALPPDVAGELLDHVVKLNATGGQTAKKN